MRHPAFVAVAQFVRWQPTMSRCVKRFRGALPAMQTPRYADARRRRRAWPRKATAAQILVRHVVCAIPRWRCAIVSFPTQD